MRHASKRRALGRLLASIPLVFVLLFGATALYAAEEYEIEAAVNDEKFVIDGEKYEAKIYCIGWDEGDTVTFVEGTPGVCISAVLYNKTRRETCEVWCE